MDISDRGDAGKCLCCGSSITRQKSLTSAFLSKRAWGGDVEYTSTYMCKSCGFAFHGRGLSEQEICNYYSGYRDDAYYVERHYYEPFYTRAAHNAVDSFLGGESRRNALVNLFDSNGIPQVADRKILDFGGGSGRLIQNMIGDKYVYDVSGESPVDVELPLLNRTPCGC